MRQPNKIEAERQRLARRIDADIMATLRLLQTQTETYRQALKGQADASMALTVLSSLLQQAIQRTQHLRNNLHPSVLETLGLEPALETFAADAKRVQGLNITLSLARLPQRLPYSVEITFFRGIQTLIDHATNHAGAARFDIHLHSQDTQTTLHYQDDGRWLPSQTRILQNLRDDLKSINGKFEARLTASHHLNVSLHVSHTKQTTLTPREREVLQWVAEGFTNKDIAAQLHLSARTVSFHLDNAYSKLGVNTRTEAVMIALQRGWIENPMK